MSSIRPKSRALVEPRIVNVGVARVACIAALLFGALTVGTDVGFAQTVSDQLGGRGAEETVVPPFGAEILDQPPPTRAVQSPVIDTRLTDFLLRNQSVVEMQGVLGDQRMNRLTLNLQTMLRVQGDTLIGERDSFLPTARRLDAEQTWLLNEDQELKQAERTFADEARDLDRQVQYHNGRCSPAHDEATYRWCLQDSPRLRKWQADYNARINDHNQRVSAYMERLNHHKPERQTFVDELTAWVGRVKALIQRTRSALNNPPDRDKQTCDWTGERVPPENGVCVYLCTVSGITFIPPTDDPDHPCPTLRPDVPIPPSGALPR